MSLVPHLASRAPEVRPAVYVAPLSQPGFDSGAVEPPAETAVDAIVSSSLILNAARAVTSAQWKAHHEPVIRSVHHYPIDHPQHQDPRYHEHTESAAQLFKKSALDPLQRPEISYGDGYRRAGRSNRFAAEPEPLSAATRLLTDGTIWTDSSIAGLREAIAFVYKETS